MARLLEDKIRYDWVILAFEEWFGIRRQYASVLAALFENDGEQKPWRTLCRKTNPHKPITRPDLEVRICKLRAAMETEAIDTIDGTYALTPGGVAECRLALARMGDVLRAFAEAA